MSRRPTQAAAREAPAKLPESPTAAAWPALGVELRPLSTLVPYARNARLHSEAQVTQIAASMREWGWTQPILVSEEGMIIAGHGRVLAGLKLGLKEAPVMTAHGWSEAKIRAYVIADNKLAENATWDAELLRIELGDLRLQGFDLALMGFDKSDLDDLFSAEGLSDAYSQRIQTPLYEPKQEEPPSLAELTDTSKAEALIAAVQASAVTDLEKAFLLRAAARHVVFDYHLIAEYYCHAAPDMQRLMEQSALVIIDFGKAVENGYVEMTRQLEALAGDAMQGDDDA